MTPAEPVRLYHVANDPRYRSPDGAVPGGTDVALAVSLAGGGPFAGVLSLRWAFGLDAFAQGTMPLEPLPPPPAAVSDPDGAMSWFGCRLRVPDEPGLLFYWFAVTEGGESTHYAGDPAGLSGWTAPLRRLAAEPRVSRSGVEGDWPFRMTVFERDFRVPDWFRGAVVYQVFPDRFRRDASFRPESALAARPDPLRQVHAAWDEEVDWTGLPETGYRALDFFGGSLEGIAMSLDDLADLGVEVLYLNPIFESRTYHRYDTADYQRIDPVLGTHEDFRRLCREAADRGIRIVLDLVLSHTGDDSRYFNRHGRYPEPGAFQEALGEGPSRYGSWYRIRKGRDGQPAYDGWWGFENLPNLVETDLGFRRFLFGEDGVIPGWLAAGASGFRLDVSDELPDDFLRELRRVVKRYEPGAVILGEVWEEAAARVSYGGFRDFLFGRTHDCVMGYPFRSALVGWLLGEIPGHRMVRQLDTLQEQYPQEAFQAGLILLGSHDVPRILTVLSGCAIPPDRAGQAALRLTPGEMDCGLARLRLAVAFQFCYPGSPLIYYGDEIGMEGAMDPFNRRPYPWGGGNGAIRAWYRQFGRLRKESPALRTGSCRLVALDDDRILLHRRSEEQDAWLLVRRDGGDSEPAAAGMPADGRSPGLQGLEGAALPEDLDHQARSLPPGGLFLWLDGRPWTGLSTD